MAKAVENTVRNSDYNSFMNDDFTKEAGNATGEYCSPRPISINSIQEENDKYTDVGLL